MLENNKPNRKKISNWMVFTSMPIQMGVTIFLFYSGGKWLDEKMDVSGGWWTKGCTLLGVVISLYYFIKQANYISKKNE